MKRRAAWALPAAIAFALAVALLDYLTPADVDFTELYMLPVILVGWTVGWRWAIAVAILAATSELAVDALLRSPVTTLPIATALWNGLAHLGVLAALAVVTDRVHHERERWRRLDRERTTLLRLLERELPRPLRAIDWFARTFEDALPGRVTDSVRSQFLTLRHHTREASFLATDVLALGRLGGTLLFERRPVELRTVAGEAVAGSLDRARVLLSLSDEPLPVLAEPDRLRHAIGSVIGRCLELSPYEAVTVLTRIAGDEAAVEIGCRARPMEPEDLELARLLIEGNGGRLVHVVRGDDRGFAISAYLPRASGLPAAERVPAAEATEPA